MTLMKTANKSMVTVSGHQVEMHKAGSGPPLLFLHGGGGFGTFNPTTSPLAEKFTVYAPAHPGFFGSERPAWLYTVVDLAHFYKDMVQELGLENYVLVGHSVGGWVAAEMAAMDHHNIKGLVLIDAAGIRPVNGEIAEVFTTPHRCPAMTSYRPNLPLKRPRRFTPTWRCCPGSAGGPISIIPACLIT